MSAPMGMGGKKSGSSSNSSMVNTPASTPVTMANGGQLNTNHNQASPPPNNAPKYGTLVPNRIFVGGISANTTETELLQLFSNYGTVKAAKIIQDRAGVSRGYGFITFESEDDAKRLQREADNIVLRERKLNIAPAIKKQPFSRAFDGSSPPTVAPGYPPNFFPPGSMPFFQGGVAYYPQPPSGPADPSTQPQAVYQKCVLAPSVYPPQSAPPQAAPYQPVMFPPQPIYMPQQYPMPMPYDYNYYSNGAGGPYMVSGANGGGGQSGGGGPQSGLGGGGQMQQMPQRPTSPPRQQCYGQHMPSAVAAAAASAAAAAAVGYPNPEAVYYNMPLYPLDGAMYADPTGGMDTMTMTNGVVTEEYQQQDSIEMLPSANHHQTTKSVVIIQHQSQPPPSQQQQQSQQAQQIDTNRQTTTPVVSLLSLESHQEKDLMSMQSGRRRKPQTSTPPTTQQHTHVPPPLIPNAYIPSPQHITTMPPPNGYTYPVPLPFDYHYPQMISNYSPVGNNNNSLQKPPQMNGYVDRSSWHNNNNNNITKRSWKSVNMNNNHEHQRRSVDTSSLSSQRTDSNSSASVVADDARHLNVNDINDKNRSRFHHYHNQQQPLQQHSPHHQLQTHQTHTFSARSHHPPNRFNFVKPMSAHYTQHTGHYQRRSFLPSNKIQYRNSNRQNHQQLAAINQHQQPTQTDGNHLISEQIQISDITDCSKAIKNSSVSSNNNNINNNNAPPPTLSTTTSTTTSAFGSQMQNVPQHFVAPARHRNRRSVRRNGPSSLGEIGAGDAPLSSTGPNDLNEACSKLDGLKL